MSDDRRFYVADAPRKPTGRLFHASSMAKCMDWIRPRSGPGLPRLAVWAAVPPPDEGPDAFVCLPIGVVEGLRETAVEVVRRWDDAWLLIESAPRRHREEARDALVDLVVEALASAAAGGFDDRMGLPF